MRFLLTIACAAALVIGGMAPAGAQGAAGDGYSINLQMGFGWAHNIMLADWMNEVRDGNSLLMGPNQKEEQEESNILYAGFDLEPRMSTGNIVFGLGIGYHNVLNGKRKITSPTGTFKQETDLTFISLKGSVYYKVTLSETSHILLGGGLGYYRPTLTITSINTATPLGTNIEGEGSGWTIGWHTQIEYNKQFGPVIINGGILSRFVECWNIEVEDQNGTEIYDQGVSLSGIYFYVGAGYMI